MKFFKFYKIVSSLNNVFELVTIEPIKNIEENENQSGTNNNDNDKESEYGTDSATGVSSSVNANDDCLSLRGQMYYISESDCVVFLPAPM